MCPTVVLLKSVGWISSCVSRLHKLFTRTEWMKLLPKAQSLSSFSWFGLNSSGKKIGTHSFVFLNLVP